LTSPHPGPPGLRLWNRGPTSLRCGTFDFRPRAGLPSSLDREYRIPGAVAALRAHGGEWVVDSPVIRVFLLDDHEVVRRGMVELLTTESDLAVVGQASTAAEALSLVPLVHPDVAVLDVRLPDGDGVSVCRDLRARMPGLRCLMLTAFADDQALFDSIMAGAAGYVLKQIRGVDLVGAIRTVAGGLSLLDPRATARVLDRVRMGLAGGDDPLSELSGQEHKLLGLLGEGLTNREIADRMGLAEKTVKNYVSHLLAKLGVQRPAQVAILATELRQLRGQPKAQRAVVTHLTRLPAWHQSHSVDRPPACAGSSGRG
jgi:two-component system response regulator DevR